MTINEAIKILDDYERFGSELTHVDLPVAIKLGKEALKGIKKLRRVFEPYVTALLPGETESRN